MKDLWKLITLTLAITLFPLTLEAEEIGAWSDRVDGIQGRLIANRVSDFYGTRMVNVYLELKNPGAGPIEIYFGDSTLKSRVVDSSESRVFNPMEASMSIFAPAPYRLIMPFDSTLRFQVSVYGYGIPKEAGTAIQMMEGLLLFKSDQNQQLFFESSFTSKAKTVDPSVKQWAGTIKLPKVLIPQ